MSDRALRDVARAVLTEVRDARLTFLAAAMAYYAFVSVVPLLLVALAVGSALGGERFAAAVVEAVGGVLAPSSESLLHDAVARARRETGATLVGTAVLLWSGLRLFRGLDEAFTQVYGVESRGLGAQVVDAVIVLGAIAVAVAAAVVVGGVLPALHVLPTALTPLPLVAALAVALFPVYYVFPDAVTEPREALPGALFAAVGWTVLIAVFAVYAGRVASVAVYGLLGGALLLSTWLYVAATVIILGGVLNAVLAGGPDDDAADEEAAADGPAPDITALDGEVERLRTRLEERTVSREALESDLRRYVRRRQRRGHARGWGPYLVLAYGTAMTLGAFYFLEGGWAILAMLVVWLSTLGLYALMVLLGVGVAAVGLPGRIRDWVRARRS